MNAVAQGRFEKRLVPSIGKYGQYRGPGRLEVTETGLRVSGRHVYSLGARWTLALGLIAGVVLLTLGTLAPGWLFIYPIVEYWWLKKEELHVSFSDISGLGVDEAETLVAVSFIGHPWCSPVVMKTPQWKDMGDALRPRLPILNQSGSTTVLTLTLNRPARAGMLLGLASIVFMIPLVQTLLAVFGFWNSVRGFRNAAEMAGIGSAAAKIGVACSVVGFIESIAIVWLILRL